MSVASNRTDWVKDLFSFRPKGAEFALGAGKRARKNIEKQCETAQEREAFEKTHLLMGTVSGLRRLQSKPLKKRYTEPKSGRKNRIHQCHWTGNKDGRIWYILKDEEPGAVAASLIIQGVYLRAHPKPHHLKDLAAALRFDDSADLMQTEGQPEDEPIEVSPGKAIELESDFDVRPLITKSFKDMMDFCNTKMGISPTNDQIEAILDSKTPIFINGQAGTGKTVMLSLRIALKHIHGVENSLKIDTKNGTCSPLTSHIPRRTLVTSLSDDVVNLMQHNVEQCLSEVFSPQKIGDMYVKGDSNSAEERGFNIGSRILVDAKDSFQQSIQQGNKDTWKSSAENNNFICFRTFREIELDLLPKDVREKFEDPSNNVKFSIFSNDFFTKRSNLYGSLSVELAWFGIRALIRGMLVDDSEHRFLNREEIMQTVDKYPKLMRDFSGNPTAIKSLIKCHEDYRTWMAERGLYDDMDLAREARKALDNLGKKVLDEDSNESSLPEFDEIYLDEAQDLTEIELRILLHLLKIKTDSDDLILAGDPLQTINPSGFSWGALRSMIHNTLKKVVEERADRSVGPERKMWEQKRTAITPPEPLPLSVNFRTPSNIVDVGNVVLEKRQYYQKDPSTLQSSSIRDGELKLFVVSDSHSNSLTKLLTQDADRYTVSGYSDSEGVKQFVAEDPHIKADPTDTRISSITQVKGLENTIVILYRMGEALTGADVNAILGTKGDRGASRDQLSPQQKLKVAYELNKLYIGLTRTQDRMLLIESSRTAELLWAGSWFEDASIEVITDPKEVEAYLDKEWDLADEKTDFGELADKWLDQYLKQLDPMYLDWADSAAKKARDYPQSKIDEIQARMALEEAKYLDGSAQTSKYLDSARLFKSAGFYEKAYTIALDYLMRTSNGPSFALEILNSKPQVSRPSGDPSIDSESRFLKLLLSEGNEGAIGDHFSDLENFPSWYDWQLKGHSDLLSNGLKSLLKNIVGQGRVKYIKSIADAGVLTRNLQEVWFQDLLPSIGPTEMWSALTDEAKLGGHVSASTALQTALDSSAEDLLKTSKSLSYSIGIMKTWGETDQLNAKNISGRAVKLMLEKEFENFTPSLLTKRKKWPFILKHDDHKALLDWAETKDFNPPSRAILLLRNIAGSNPDWPRMELTKLSGFKACLELDISDLDRDTISDAAIDTTHLTKHLRQIGEDWVVSKSKDEYKEIHGRKPKDRLLGLPLTEIWEECCGNRGEMENLLWILFDSNPLSDESNFCRKMVNSYETGNKSSNEIALGGGSEGWSLFKLQFERYAMSLLSERNISNDKLIETLCEKGNQAKEISKSKHIHQHYIDFAKAYLQYKSERAQQSPDEIRTLAARFEKLGYTEYADKLQSDLPTDLSLDIPMITDSSLDAKTKINKILSKLNSAQGVTKAELKSNFVKFILDLSPLRNTLLAEFMYFKPELKSFTDKIKIAKNDDVVLQYFKWTLFEFLFHVGKGEIKSNDTNRLMLRFIREELDERMKIFQTQRETYTVGYRKLMDEMWYEEQVEKLFKSAALLEIFRIKELPQNTPGYMTIDGLVELRRNIGQDVPKSSATRSVHFRAIFDEFAGDKLFEGNDGLVNLSLK